MKFKNYKKFIHTERVGNLLVFYLNDKNSRYQLFSKKAHPALCHKFRKDTSVPLLLRQHKWGVDKVTDHVMEILPRYISYIEKYVA